MMAGVRRAATPSPEARELYRLLRDPHLQVSDGRAWSVTRCALVQSEIDPGMFSTQAFLSAHDTVARKDYEPMLPPLPDSLPDDEEAVRIVCLVKNNQPLGATIKRDELTGEIFVARVIHGGLADRSGLLYAGDKLIEVNGQPVEGMEPEQVIEILAHSHGTIMFKLVPMSDRPVNSQTLLYVRAMLDYNPRQDPAIPCADAGMAFRRGDVLEIVDQTDGLWWQARKTPSLSACAGLIPSAELLRRCKGPQEDIDESFIETDPDTFESEEEEYSTNPAGIYLAGFRRSMRLSRRKSDSNHSQSCYSRCPSSCYSILANPYEEVVRHRRHPQDKPRLVALMGPSGVGVNELRRRLIAMDPNTFQGPVPHTTRPRKHHEEWGREYHFIGRELFENMVYNHRFLEYGEYRGHLYGTSINAIKSVLDSGKICVVDIEPHGIRVVRTHELRAYIIFVKPPSAARMKLTRTNARITAAGYVNRPFREEDFQEIEEEGARMESQHCHFFDHLIVNDGLQDSCVQLLAAVKRAQDEPQWVPASWLRPTDVS
ncbi:MAGUK p55 subfamily member 4-like [Scleropages formosus]|uniref:MAGUK p55 subfamily member 4-like n=1 Tax=Scleropages formosus TaxID=113540 RepID=A0A0P7VGK6_SCLFO|nr:MAGUK p55 subfamily member 4-like [Scleropages formosus]